MGILDLRNVDGFLQYVLLRTFFLLFGEPVSRYLSIDKNNIL
jgi:hypothetical protein